VMVFKRMPHVLEVHPLSTWAQNCQGEGRLTQLHMLHKP